MADNIFPQDLFNLLRNYGISFYTGVPDSSLKHFCAYVNDTLPQSDHIITANEGNAVALATGYHLATGKIPLVYMQNSGQGNTVNPLTSLTDSEVYSIPLLLLIGWRGEPGTLDEPQHVKQGKITLPLLETLGIPYSILPQSLGQLEHSLKVVFDTIKRTHAPYALVVRKGTFDAYIPKETAAQDYTHTRESALEVVVKHLVASDIVVSTTGKLSRELFEYREEKKQGHSQDFLTVGSMGHASSIALGVASQKKNRTVYCFDGDGALIMHMGSLAIIGQQKPANFKHIVFNNESHDSVGGQPTAAKNVDIPSLARAAGYVNTLQANTTKEIDNAMRTLKERKGPALLEIKVRKGSRKDLGRPTTTSQENKKAFMKFVNED